MAAKKTAAYIIIVILAGIILLNILGQPANILTSKKPNVLFLMLDTLRADHMSVYGYQRNTTPNLDLFAEENLLFLNAISVAPWTPPSIASMFTGLYPTEHGMMPYAHRKKAIKTSTILKDELETIAEMYKKGGYKTAAISSNPWIGPDFGYTQGFDDFLHINRAKAEKINQAAFEKLQGFKNEGKSFFLYLHYLDPHWPYAPPDEFKEMYENQEPVTYNGENIYTDKEQNFINLYNGEISYLDHHLQLLFDKLKSLSLYDDLIIIVVGDHGEQFMEHGAQGHGYYLYNEEIHVPLMLKVPGQEASQIQQTVSTIDILPTLLKLSNLKVPTKLKGLDLLDKESINNRIGVFSEINHKVNQKAFTSLDGKKIIYDCGETINKGGTEDNCQEIIGVFDRNTDYLELNAISDQELEDELSDKFKQIYGSVLRSRVERGAGDEIEIPADTLEELKSLGYF